MSALTKERADTITMILKPYRPDPRIEEAAAMVDGSAWAEMRLRIRQAGARGEGEVAHYLDYDIATDDNAVLIHDLRLKEDAYSCQIDHLTIDRLLRMSVIETKNFTTDLKITEDGTFLRYDNAASDFIPIPSPLAQARRNANFLARYVEKHLKMPRVPPFFERREPEVQFFVLINSSAKIIRPASFDTSRILSAERYGEYHALRFAEQFGGWRSIKVLGFIPKIVTRKRMTSFGKELLDHHVAVAEPTSAGPRKLLGNVDYVCRSCSDSDVEIRHGYNYHWHCKNCGTKASIKVPPAHTVVRMGEDFHIVPAVNVTSAA